MFLWGCHGGGLLPGTKPVAILSQVADRFDDIVEAQIWTVIGLLAATLIGTLVYLGGRIESLGARVDGRLDVLSSEVRAQSVRIDGISSRMDGLSARIEEQGAHLGDRIYELAIKLDDHLRRHAS
jgi:hypothetical protein